MAIRPDYKIGTVTLTSGSKDFTTTGSSLESAAVTGGDTIMTADGLVLIIDEITGQNSGTLLNESPVTVVDEPLVIRFQPDGSKYQGAARDLIGRWGQSGNVDAFAGLAGVVDGVPVFTGAGTMEIQGKDTFVTPDPNGNLAELAGLSDVGNLAELAAIAKDNNQFIIMGASGEITLRPMSDIDNAIASLQTGKFNNPTGSVGQFLRGNGGLQDIVGTVTQSGGAIVQMGSNVNGSFARFAGGLQMCWAGTVMNPPNIPYGSFFRGDDKEWVYPSAFISGSEVSAFTASAGTNTIWGVISSVTTSSAFFSAFRPTTSNTEYAMRVFAIGRWF